ncbi:MAG: hypothetical protein JWR59_125 [Brevundimonas sp.]|nr:hypothetical protein [Brevundimonas sp.]
MLALGKASTPPQKRYVVRTLAFMGGYSLIMVAVIFGAFDQIQHKPAAWLLALTVTAPICGQIWTTLAYMRESDEFMRAVMAKQFILSAGIAMALFTGWGFAESFANAPHAEGWLIYPLFWAVQGVTAPFLKSSH